MDYAKVGDVGHINQIDEAKGRILIEWKCTRKECWIPKDGFRSLPLGPFLRRTKTPCVIFSGPPGAGKTDVADKLNGQGMGRASDFRLKLHAFFAALLSLDLLDATAERERERENGKVAGVARF